MTQLLASDDLFTENATHYGQKLAGYIRLVPWAADAATGYSIPAALGHLHSGYFNLAGGTPHAKTPAAFTSPASGTSTGHLCCVLWRPYYAARCKATLAAQCYVTNGVYNDTFRYAGVTVRNTGGSYDDTAGIEAISSGSGYFFLLANSAAVGGAKWLLLRVNSGTITVLAQTAFLTLDGATATRLIQIELEVADSGGNVVLTPQVLFTGGSVSEDPIELSNPFGSPVIDSSGSKLTAAGRAGFCMNRERVQTGPTIRSVTVASYFSIFDTDAGAVVHEDEWQRASLSGATQVSGELNLKNGRMLSSMWGADVAGISSLKAKRDAGNNRILFDAVGSYGMWSQVPAQHPASQRRKVTANFATSVNQRSVAIQLRGSNLHSSLSRVCYNAELRRTGLGDWECRIYDQRVGYTLLALKTGIAGLAVDTDIVFELQAENAGGADVYTGEARLIVRIDNVAITGWSVGASGIEVQASGLVIDRRSARILTGSMEGLEVTLNNTTEAVRVDTWLYVAPATGDLGESAQASIDVSTEVDGATGTLELPRSWVVGIRKKARHERHVMASRHVVRVAFDTGSRRRWPVRARPCSETERAALASFYDSHKGVEVPFNWTTPDGEAVVAAFVDPSLGVTLRAPIVRDLEFELEERRA